MNTKNNQTTTQPTAQELKKLYAVKTRYGDIGKITEYVIIKETPKTYIATRATDPTARWSQRTVKKADPQVYDDYFCVGYYEALLYKKQILEKRIAGNEREIAEKLAENEKHRAAIEATAAEIEKLNGGINQ